MRKRAVSKLPIENPSSRLFVSKIWKCDYCKTVFDSVEELCVHLDLTGHRICFKCGQKVGGMVEWVKHEFETSKEIKEDGTEIWKYVHTGNCPKSNPSQRVNVFENN